MLMSDMTNILGMSACLNIVSIQRPNIFPNNPQERELPQILILSQSGSGGPIRNIHNIDHGEELQQVHNASSADTSIECCIQFFTTSRRRIQPD